MEIFQEIMIETGNLSTTGCSRINLAFGGPLLRHTSNFSIQRRQIRHCNNSTGYVNTKGK